MCCTWPPLSFSSSCWCCFSLGRAVRRPSRLLGWNSGSRKWRQGARRSPKTKPTLRVEPRGRVADLASLPRGAHLFVRERGLCRGPGRPASFQAVGMPCLDAKGRALECSRRPISLGISNLASLPGLVDQPGRPSRHTPVIGSVAFALGGCQSRLVEAGMGSLTTLQIHSTSTPKFSEWAVDHQFE